MLVLEEALRRCCGRLGGLMASMLELLSSKVYNEKRHVIVNGDNVLEDQIALFQIVEDQDQAQQ